MKITKTYLRQVIKEELAAVMEGEDDRVVSLAHYRKKREEEEKKERKDRKIPVRRWAEDIRDYILAIEGGEVLLDRLAADLEGEEDTEGRAVLLGLAPDLEGEEDTEGLAVLQALEDHDEQQLNWVLFNVINAWREQREDL